VSSTDQGGWKRRPVIAAVVLSVFAKKGLESNYLQGQVSLPT
jgi:hypothetical protein